MPPAPELVVVGVTLAPLLLVAERVASSRARMPRISPCSDDSHTDGLAKRHTRRQGSSDVDTARVVRQLGQAMAICQ